MNPTLFDLPPAARNSDPVTSHVAAASVDRPADVEMIMHVVENTIWGEGGLTSMEIADQLIDSNRIHWTKAVSVSKRCSDAVAAGRAVRLPARRCAITGNTAHPIKAAAS